MRPIISNFSKIASELSNADSIPHTRQVLRQWKDAGTLGSNLDRTLRNEFAQQVSTPTSHADIPALSNLNMSEPRAGETEVSIQALQDFLGPASVWSKNYHEALHKWSPSANTFGKNYASSVKVHDPTPLQSFLQKSEDQSISKQSVLGERDQGSGSGAAKPKDRWPTDNDLVALAEQLERQISTRLGED